MSTQKEKIGGTPTNLERVELAKNILSNFQKVFDPYLFNFFDREIKNVGSVRKELVDLLQVGEEFVRNGGKRLRPAFMYFGYKAAGGKNEEMVLGSAISVELVHNGALIHDDIMDNSDLRRGKPTVHISLANKVGNAELGRGAAIVMGDTVLALASKALSEFSRNSENANHARALFDQMCLEIDYGQFLDLLGNISDRVDVDWVMKVMEYKTARYTIEKPLLIGAALAGADEKTLNTLSSYAIPLGIAFQIQDDILGMFGDEKKVGKPIDSDLKEGKKTLLVLKTISSLRDADRIQDVDRFKSILGNSNLTQEDYHWAQQIIIETGALEYCKSLAKQLIESSQESIKELKIQDPNTTTFLEGIANFILERSY